MTATMEEANTAMRSAVESRLAESCCDGGKCHADTGYASDRWKQKAHESAEKYAERLPGDSLLTASDVHPSSQRFFDCLDALREMHISKSAGYGAPDGTDPLANIRNGAKFVGISPWKAAMVRFSDKVTRIHTYLMTGSLSHESLTDNLMDAASYAVLAKLLYEEEHGTQS